MGGAGSVDAVQTVTLRWFVGNTMCMDASGTISLYAPSAGRTVNVQYAVDVSKGILTLKNDPNEGAYVVPVSVEAYASNWQQSATAQAQYEATGMEEGWGEDYQRFMRWLYHVNHPVPKPRVGPPMPDSSR
jgi:hypothetical protein